MVLTLHRPQTVEAFLAAAAEFLTRREAENNVVLGVTGMLRAHPELFVGREPSFAFVADGHRVVAATVRAPPRQQLLSTIDVPEAVDLLAEALASQPLPGVFGPADATARFAERWSRTTGRASHLEMAERNFRLERVIPPARPASGRWRLAAPRDRALLARWLVDFTAEALPEEPPMQRPLEAVDHMLEGIGGRLYVWEDEGDVVSMVRAGSRTPHGVRIGPVYTPPDRRGRGYASSLVAATSQDQLDHGRRFVFLLTDLANPTSNDIYQAIGYEPICDMSAFRFAAHG